MSTKVYVAYKLAPQVSRSNAKFWKWFRDTLHRGEQEVQKVLRILYDDFAQHIEVESEAYKSFLGEAEDSPYRRLSFARDTVYKGYRTQQGSARRNAFDFDVSITIRELYGSHYIIPHCDILMRDVLNFLQEDPRLIDFAYWNNSDPPEGMREGDGYRHWEQRGKVWDALNENWRDYMLMVICEPEKFIYIDPWLDMVRERKALEKS